VRPAGLQPPAPAAAAVARGPRRLRIRRRVFVGDSFPRRELRQHRHPGLAHPLRGHVPQRRRHRRVGRRPRRRSPRHRRHDFQVRPSSNRRLNIEPNDTQKNSWST
jgi:hypothetical protein